ncbi:DUF4157 domain-containing protein, partial [Moorena sp. SIO4G3]|uniref:eCIS core domain-containing protein n=1 Tax=Moorena sp. SIO4G3 TaxID=2607821 RepID=UPI0025DBEB7A
PVTSHTTQPDSIQAQGQQDELMRKPMVQLQSVEGGMAATPELESSIQQAKGSGMPIALSIRKPMEQSFGADFSGVRVHSDAQSDQLNQSIQARAFTTGKDIFFRQGEYNPGSRGGQELIAHELTHVVQQNRVSGSSQSVNHSANIQRKVGFEFETSWRVRDLEDVDDEAKTEHKNVVEAWEFEIDRKLLNQIAEQPNHSMRINEDQAVGDPTKAWYSKFNSIENPADPNQVTEAGKARIQKMRDHNQYRSLFKEVVQTLRLGNALSAKPLLGKNVDKGAKLIEATKYDLTADASPAGGSNLEWVTAPLTSTAEVDSVMTNLTKMVHQFNSKKDDESIKLDEIGSIAGGGTKAKQNLVIYPEGGSEMVFEPQTTVGIGIDKLGKLLQYVSDDKKHLLESKSTFQKRQQAKADLFGAGGLDTLVTADARAKTVVKAFEKTLPPKIKTISSKELQGLITLLASYLKNASNLGDQGNAKSIAGALMARTDFAHNFKLMPNDYQQYFKKQPQKFVDLVLEGANMPGTSDQKVYPNTVARGSVNARSVREISLTKQMWLENITQGVDLLKHYSNLSDEAKAVPGVTEEDWQGFHRSLGALGSVEDEVGHDRNRTKALVVEFRRMFFGEMKEADLKPTAKAVYELVEQLNANQRLKYNK